MTKGGRALLEEAAPDVCGPLPRQLRQEATVRFDPAVHDLYSATAALLGSLGESFGHFPAAGARASSMDGLCALRIAPVSAVRVSLTLAWGWSEVCADTSDEGGMTDACHPPCVPSADACHLDASHVPCRQRLEAFQPVRGAFTSFHVKQRLYQAAGRDARLLRAYDRLVQEVVLPHLKDALQRAGDEHGGSPCSFWVQRPPSIRLQPPDPAVHGRLHSDDEYGHQPGECNFWMPLTALDATQTSLCVESEPGRRDFHPLQVTYGEIARFHGTLCRHHAPPNRSSCTRVSLDFRVGVGRFFDPHWQLRGAKAQHTRVEVRV